MVGARLHWQQGIIGHENRHGRRPPGTRTASRFSISAKRKRGTQAIRTSGEVGGRPTGQTHGPATVATACADYLAHLANDGRNPKNVTDARRKVEAHILPKLGAVPSASAASSTGRVAGTRPHRRAPRRSATPATRGARLARKPRSRRPLPSRSRRSTASPACWHLCRRRSGLRITRAPSCRPTTSPGLSAMAATKTKVGKT